MTTPSTAARQARGYVHSNRTRWSLPGALIRLWFPRLAERIRFVFRASVKRAAFAFFRLGCVRYDISGLTFYLPFRNNEEFERAKANVKDAVWAIDRFDPSRMRRIRRDLSNGIYAFPIKGAALYHRDIGVCVLSQSRLLAGGYVSTALSIVHEAAHARMRYLPNSVPRRRARMERMCIGAEIAFVSRLPDNGPTLAALIREQDQIASAESDT